MFFAKRLLAVLLAGNCLPASAAPLVAGPGASPISRIDPTFWWVGMKNPKPQLLVHGPGRQ